MSFTIPNQILHYTASSPGYPAHAIRVGNFALSDAGNAPTGSYGEFRGGLNPYAFTTSTDGQSGFQKQTYAVYIDYNDPVDGCRYGPACHLIDGSVIIPASDNQYPGVPGPYEPWYSLVKFTQYIAGSVSDGITEDIGYYGETLNNTFDSGIVDKTLRWYSDQLSLDPNTYIGGTAGNRVVVNKFYPPIIVNTASRIFDASYVPSNRFAGFLTNDTGVNPGGALLYNLRGATHATSTTEVNGLWDFEGGYIYKDSSYGNDDLQVAADGGFCPAGASNNPNWTLNMYFSVINVNNDDGNYLIKQGTISGSNTSFGIRYKDTVGGGNSYQIILARSGVMSTTSDQVLFAGLTFSLNTWYHITIVREAVNSTTYHSYLNGKLIATNTNLSDYDNSFSPGTEQAVDLLFSDQNYRTANLQYLSYYPIYQGDSAVRENFLRYSLNSKIRNGNILLALDTGSKASHTGSTKWTDISGNDLHGVTASFDWQDHKPKYTSKNFKITHNSFLNDIFREPFCLSMWVYVVDAGIPSLIFRKGDFDISLASSAFSFVFS
jgi:hypothetical protein